MSPVKLVSMILLVAAATFAQDTTTHCTFNGNSADCTSHDYAAERQAAAAARAERAKEMQEAYEQGQELGRQIRAAIDAHRAAKAVEGAPTRYEFASWDKACDSVLTQHGAVINVTNRTAMMDYVQGHGLPSLKAKSWEEAYTNLQPKLEANHNQCADGFLNRCTPAGLASYKCTYLNVLDQCTPAEKIAQCAAGNDNACTTTAEKVANKRKVACWQTIHKWEDPCPSETTSQTAQKEWRNPATNLVMPVLATPQTNNTGKP